MTDLFANEAFRTYALCSALLALNLIVIANLTPIVRARTKTLLNAEDLRVAAKGVEVVSDEHPNVARVLRAHRNALENIPMFFAIGLLYALSSPSALGARAYFFTFTAARWLHTIFYLKAMQPWRTLIFVVSLLCLAGMMVHVIRVAVA